MSNRKIVLFFVITYVWTWLLWLPYVLPYFDLFDVPGWLYDIKTLIMVLGASGPLVSALILIVHDKGISGVKSFFKKCFDFKIKPKYIFIAIGLSVFSMIIAHYFPNIFGLERLPNSYFPVEAGLPIVVTFIIYIFVMFLIGGGQEEFGWRGYILDPLQDKIGLLKASLLIGVLWGIWHLPLWLMPDESHAYYSFIGFVLFAISFSVIIGVMYEVSGRKFIIAWIMHSLSNFALSMFPVFFMEDVAQPAYWVMIIINIITAVIIVLWFLNKRKLKLNNER